MFRPNLYLRKCCFHQGQGRVTTANTDQDKGTMVTTVVSILVYHLFIPVLAQKLPIPLPIPHQAPVTPRPNAKTKA